MPNHKISHRKKCPVMKCMPCAPCPVCPHQQEFIPVKRAPQRMFSTVQNINQSQYLTDSELAMEKARERRLGRSFSNNTMSNQSIKGRRSPMRSVGKMRPQGRRSQMRPQGRRSPMGRKGRK